MNIHYHWNQELSLKEMSIHLNPQNQFVAEQVSRIFAEIPELTVINPTNDRRSRLAIMRILIIESMDHLSKIYTIEDQLFYIKGRLHDFTYLEDHQFFRINNSTILNLSEMVSFKNGQHARLEVQTKNGQIYFVSRHYAKQLKEKLR